MASAGPSAGTGPGPGAGELKSARLQDKQAHVHEALLDFQAAEWARREADTEGSGCLHGTTPDRGQHPAAGRVDDVAPAGAIVRAADCTLAASGRAWVEVEVHGFATTCTWRPSGERSWRR